MAQMIMIAGTATGLLLACLCMPTPTYEGQTGPKAPSGHTVSTDELTGPELELLNSRKPGTATVDPTTGSVLSVRPNP